MEYRWESREQEEKYAAMARGFESRDAMHAYYGTSRSKDKSRTPGWRYVNGKIQFVDPADDDDENDYERRLERAEEGLK
jgi:hypothetical protein